MQTLNLKFNLGILLLLILSNQLNTQKMVKKEAFQQDSQTKSFLVFMFDILPTTQSTDEFWSVSPYSLDRFKLSTGDVLRRVQLMTHSHCVRETNDQKYMLYSLNKSQRKLYGFDLKTGKIEEDLELPILETEKWVTKVARMNCLEQGLELEVVTNKVSKAKKFVFYKEYEDLKVSVSDESVQDLPTEIMNKEIYHLEHVKEKRGESKAQLNSRLHSQGQTRRNAQFSGAKDQPEFVYPRHQTTQHDNLPIEDKLQTILDSPVVVQIRQKHQPNGVQNHILGQRELVHEPASHFRVLHLFDGQTRRRPLSGADSGSTGPDPQFPEDSECGTREACGAQK